MKLLHGKYPKTLNTSDPIISREQSIISVSSSPPPKASKNEDETTNKESLAEVDDNIMDTTKEPDEPEVAKSIKEEALDMIKVMEIKHQTEVETIKKQLKVKDVRIQMLEEELKVGKERVEGWLIENKARVEGLIRDNQGMQEKIDENEKEQKRVWVLEKAKMLKDIETQKENAKIKEA